ncbi:MAG: hypothetical protein HKO53_08225 [Gemmatimonadetes bacterium]|nr:hypothetical protein [Gemmatimonadota bacterium]NNM33038.1 hypothetical protein [Gemmatimonadota bacterium]
MRTTLTLDPDVASALERLRAKRDDSLKATVNAALRVGLRALEDERPEEASYATPAVSLGGCLIGSLDDVADALALAEGEDFS